MSSKTLGRLPEAVQHILRQYKHKSTALRRHQNPVVRKRIRQNTFEYDFFNRQRLRNGPLSGGLAYDPSDFAPMVNVVLAPLFENKEIDVSPDNLTSDQKLKRHTDHFARLLTSLAAYYSPLESVPPVSHAIKSYRWYQKLLRETPIIFFLKQKQRLMAEATLHSINPSARSFARDLQKLKSGVRSYHFTNLASTDLFKLAVFAQRPVAKDSLCELLHSTKRPRILHNEKEIDLGQVTDSLYDIAYNDLYILTVEPAIVHHNHLPLIGLIQKHKDFQIAAVRLSLEIVGAFEQQLPQPSEPSYEQLLKKAKGESNTTAMLLEKLGQIGLVAVETGPAGAYVFGAEHT